MSLCYDYWNNLYNRCMGKSMVLEYGNFKIFDAKLRQKANSPQILSAGLMLSKK